MNRNYQNHWDKAYEKTPVSSLGWFEESATPTMELIEICKLSKDAHIFNAGAGATTLIKELLNKGFNNITVNDISSQALTELSTSLGEQKNDVKFILDDLTNPSELLKLKNVDLWNDRAVLHFFTEKSQQLTYFNLLKNAVKKEGYVILAEFNLNGAKKCCGLDVYNYDEAMLQSQLGEDFELVKLFNYTYTQPSGTTREYIYTLFKRVNC